VRTCQRVVVTGAGGLVGSHVRALLLASNGQRLFRREAPAFDIVTVSREQFSNPDSLATSLSECDIVLHLAGINRAEPAAVEGGNQEIAAKLISALEATAGKAHVVYANTTHAAGDTPYGRGKRRAGEMLASWAQASGGGYTGIVLPHIFGEGGMPFYNTVTATLCEQVATGQESEIHSGAEVELLHAGTAAELMLESALTSQQGEVRAEGVKMSVSALYQRIRGIGEDMSRDVFPDLTDSLQLQLYNTYRFSRFPEPYPMRLPLNIDDRGSLFEAARGGGGGQTFLSWTRPGVVRGNHFHRRKVERFVVVEGQADIHVRSIFDDEVHTFPVRGDEPVAIDMPTLHTHSIVNTGDSQLLTLFWAHEVFDSEDPDTYLHPVLEQVDAAIKGAPG